MGTNVSTNYITCPVDPKKTLAIKLPFLVMIIKNVKSNCLKYSWKSISLSRFKFWTIKTFVVVSEHPTIRSACCRACFPPSLRCNPSSSSVHDTREAVHLHNAHAIGRRMESNTIQPLGLYPPRLRHELHRDTASADSRELQNEAHLLFWPPL